MDLQSLRDLVGANTSLQPESYSSSAIPEGVAKGWITEICGPGKTSLVVELLREHPDTKAVWIELQPTIYPCALLQREIALNRILFIEAKKDLSWTVLQALKSQLFQFVILSHTKWNLKDLRRLQLSAERSASSVLLLNDEPHKAWPIRRQYHTQDLRPHKTSKNKAFLNSVPS